MRLHVVVGQPAARPSCWILRSSSRACLIWTSIEQMRALLLPPSSRRPRRPSLWSLRLLRLASARRSGVNMLDWPDFVAAGKGRG